MHKHRTSMNIQKYIPSSIIHFIKIYFTVLVIFTLFRLILFFTEFARISSAVDTKDIFLAFLMGLRFDVVVSSYILVLPFAVGAVTSILNYQSTFVQTLTTWFIIVLFSVEFLISAIDIPYFNQFYSRFTISAFEWGDSPIFVMKMVVQEPRYWLFVVPYILFVYLFYRVTKKVFADDSTDLYIKRSVNIFVSVVFLFLILVGIRGRLEEKSPIRIGTAYFSNNAFLNQLGLNPSFTFLKSYLESLKDENKKIMFMDDAIAISNVQQYLNIQNPNKAFPLYREIKVDSMNVTNPNVVLIIMESMSAGKMARHGNINGLTPFLDSISHKSYYFENTYTAGIHTYNGIFSSLFSYPALYRQHPMKQNTISNYDGIFSTLKTKGYSTIYFTTHDGQFDNVEGFLKANNCETVISKPDYPSDKVKTTLGVPDDFMFEFSIPVLTKLSQKDKPFFAAFMTASDHGPYYLPDYFKPKNKGIKKQIVEYADYSLKKFIDLSSKQKWFNNTIFVFVADHGSPLDGDYNMSIDYNHTPLIFYAPHLFKEHKTMSNMAGQIDVFPTIMGLLKLQYGNNTLGVDLFKDERPYIFFSADDKYGVMDNNWFLIVNTDKSKGLYNYRTKDTHNYADEKSDIVEKMNLYAESNFQAFQYVLNENKQ